MTGLITVRNGGEGCYEEKKSRFLAAVYSVESDEQAASYIEAARRKYWDARHNCYAFVIGNNNETTRCSDDGEPSGTAGKPILEVITRAGIHNCDEIFRRNAFGDRRPCEGVHSCRKGCACNVGAYNARAGRQIYDYYRLYG